MSRYDESTGPGIGATLKDARRRLGMDIKEAEERTKIRTRYLRALEAEDWEVLPAPAYVRGFLRTYGQILGLDGEVLADRYRRSYEEPVGRRAAPPPSRCCSNRRARRVAPTVARAGWIVVVGAVVIVALLVVLAIIGLTSGGDDGARRRRATPGRPAAAGDRRPREREDGGDEADGGLEPIDLTIEPLDTVQVCLVGDSREPADRLAGARRRRDRGVQRREVLPARLGGRR